MSFRILMTSEMSCTVVEYTKIIFVFSDDNIKKFAISRAYRLSFSKDGETNFNGTTEWVTFSLKSTRKLRYPPKMKIGYEAPSIHNNFTPIPNGSNKEVARCPAFISKLIKKGLEYTTLRGSQSANDTARVASTTRATATTRIAANTRVAADSQCDEDHDGGMDIEQDEPIVNDPVDALSAIQGKQFLIQSCSNVDGLNDILVYFHTSRFIAAVALYTDEQDTSAFVVRNEGSDGLSVFHLDPSGVHSAVRPLETLNGLGVVLSRSESRTGVGRPVFLSILKGAACFLASNKRVARKAFPAAMNRIVGELLSSTVSANRIDALPAFFFKIGSFVQSSSQLSQQTTGSPIKIFQQKILITKSLQ
ncbi:hypothetical protein PPL_12128 [Heterostelium album PN500]|uniref:Uncharacterized protein n=1 Tax=Heterostelium pallidum (strain ATCC 26659 / Pp 5 / PN500) TaxID=670386 RepID=D3BLS4_HETP5|nr:hypothetical protein PPL_12128 [Heterostelium album PN500]EFA77525.1 hypothetical protein PPL_12128 [Heterostelium album PN500]|eukprot:XP_020429653.1 hypothetical protein PPL_12128 [Heterostelium album PN500]